ncbi:hypothetical protein [Zunongwangia endophytica]|uniref:Uncharacterized protein n=1 Tax=Zunongwangia endophytica TaxID=1808945 RepID=A0ABV8H9M3_9FLAO|nr:hypothetical protein [Zunongwangia endophytica]MDN3594891.1 hypothetical protein [Zunongwangia endophytica]
MKYCYSNSQGPGADGDRVKWAKKLSKEETSRYSVSNIIDF